MVGHHKYATDESRRAGLADCPRQQVLVADRDRLAYDGQKRAHAHRLSAEAGRDRILIQSVQRLHNPNDVARALLILVLMDSVIMIDGGVRLVCDLEARLGHRLAPRAILDVRHVLVEWQALPDRATDQAVRIVKEAVLRLDSMVEAEGDQEIAFVEVGAVLEG